MITVEQERLFLSKYMLDWRTGCWVFQGSILATGYGSFGIGSMKDGSRCSELAHRVSWMIHFGDITDDLCVLHKCDNRPCVNPEHLFLGTKADNTHDMLSKDRHPHGARDSRAKLTAAQVQEIIVRDRAGESHRDIARDYNVHQVTISNAARGATYRTEWEQACRNLEAISVGTKKQLGLAL